MLIFVYNEKSSPLLFIPKGVAQSANHCSVESSGKISCKHLSSNLLRLSVIKSFSTLISTHFQTASIYRCQEDETIKFVFYPEIYKYLIF